MDSLNVTGKISVTGSGGKTRSTGDVLPFPIGYTDSVPLTTGTGADQANDIYDEFITLAAGASITLDLSGTAIQNPFGTNIAFTGIKMVLLDNPSLTETLTVGNAASAQWLGWMGAATNTETVPPRGHLFRDNPSAGGWVVTAGTADQLKITNSGGAQTIFRLILVGDLA